MGSFMEWGLPRGCILDPPDIDPELWVTCAGPLLRIAAPQSMVVYFPQGHAEQESSIAVASQQAQSIPHPPQMLCRVLGVTAQADRGTEGLSLKYRLLSLQQCSADLLAEVHQSWRMAVVAHPSDEDASGAQGRRENAVWKVLSMSDASPQGGFSLPRKVATVCLPPLDMDQEMPSQIVLASDLFNNPWEFRHVYRGSPLRHVLTASWNAFVAEKSLEGGDRVVFLRGSEGRVKVGIRRASRLASMVDTVTSADHVFSGANASHASGAEFEVVCKITSTGMPSFVVPLDHFFRGLKQVRALHPGRRVMMTVEKKDFSVFRFKGTVSHSDGSAWEEVRKVIEAPEAAGVPNLASLPPLWRLLKVDWIHTSEQAQAGITRPFTVCPWEITLLESKRVFTALADTAHPSPQGVAGRGSWEGTVLERQVQRQSSWPDLIGRLEESERQHPSSTVNVTDANRVEQLPRVIQEEGSGPLSCVDGSYDSEYRSPEKGTPGSTWPLESPASCPARLPWRGPMDADGDDSVHDGQAFVARVGKAEQGHHRGLKRLSWKVTTREESPGRNRPARVQHAAARGDVDLPGMESLCSRARVDPGAGGWPCGSPNHGAVHGSHSPIPAPQLCPHGSQGAPCAPGREAEESPRRAAGTMGPFGKRFTRGESPTRDASPSESRETLDLLGGLSLGSASPARAEERHLSAGVDETSLACQPWHAQGHSLPSSTCSNVRDASKGAPRGTLGGGPRAPATWPRASTRGETVEDADQEHSVEVLWDEDWLLKGCSDTNEASGDSICRERGGLRESDLAVQDSAPGPEEKGLARDSQHTSTECLGSVPNLSPADMNTVFLPCVWHVHAASTSAARAPKVPQEQHVPAGRDLHMHLQRVRGDARFFVEGPVHHDCQEHDDDEHKGTGHETGGIGRPREPSDNLVTAMINRNPPVTKLSLFGAAID